MADTSVEARIRDVAVTELYGALEPRSTLPTSASGSHARRAHSSHDLAGYGNAQLSVSYGVSAEALLFAHCLFEGTRHYSERFVVIKFWAEGHVGPPAEIGHGKYFTSATAS